MEQKDYLMTHFILRLNKAGSKRLYFMAHTTNNLTEHRANADVFPLNVIEALWGDDPSMKNKYVLIPVKGE